MINYILTVTRVSQAWSALRDGQEGGHKNNKPRKVERIGANESGTRNSHHETHRSSARSRPHRCL